jgi:drug/metabolite transporter (DMT)-like permease
LEAYLAIAEFFAAHRGELAGLAAAACWALTSLIFSRVAAPAGAIALFKNTVSCGLLLLTLVLVSKNPDSLAFVLEADLETWLYLGASAVSGLVLGDTCYFRSLQILGPRRTLVVTTLVPPIGALCGWFLLSETLPWIALAGIALTVSGVIWVIREKPEQDESEGHFPGSTSAGVKYGLLACCGQALAAALAKAPMNDGLGSLEATFIRMVVAVVIGFLAAGIAGRLREWTTRLRPRSSWLPLIPASFFGTYLGVWLCMYAYEHTKIGVATTMHSTSPIFILPLAFFVLRQRTTPRAILGAIIAVAGIFLLFQGET